MIGTTNVPGLSSSHTSEMISSSVQALQAQIDKMNHITSITCASDGWQGSNKSRYQLHNVTGVTASDRPEVFYNADSIAQADAETYFEECNKINKIETLAGQIKVWAYDVPAVNIYIDLKGI